MALVSNQVIECETIEQWNQQLVPQGKWVQQTGINYVSGLLRYLGGGGLGDIMVRGL